MKTKEENTQNACFELIDRWLEERPLVLRQNFTPSILLRILWCVKGAAVFGYVGLSFRVREYEPFGPLQCKNPEWVDDALKSLSDLGIFKLCEAVATMSDEGRGQNQDHFVIIELPWLNEDSKNFGELPADSNCCPFHEFINNWLSGLPNITANDRIIAVLLNILWASKDWLPDSALLSYSVGHLNSIDRLDELTALQSLETAGIIHIEYLGDIGNGISIRLPWLDKKSESDGA